VVSQTITVQDQSGIAPGITLINPLQNALFHFPSGGNVTSAQSFSLSVGVTASANAIRTETIQYTLVNKDLMKFPAGSCKTTLNGFSIEGDLRIKEFIHDKVSVAALGDTTLGLRRPGASAFNNFTEEITFVAAYGGTLTPTWKLARISANTSSNLLVGERIITNDLVITLGKFKTGYKPDTDLNAPPELDPYAMAQHISRVQATAIAVSITGQSH
ncbi:MAG: hypothetical protein WBX25_14210, partial [Rhodomicrobium sp.]